MSPPSLENADTLAKIVFDFDKNERETKRLRIWGRKRGGKTAAPLLHLAINKLQTKSLYVMFDFLQYTMQILNDKVRILFYFSRIPRLISR